MESKQECKPERKTGSSKRRQQRQCIVECLYMWDMQKEIPIESLFEIYYEEKMQNVTPKILRANFVLESLKGIVNHQEFIDEKIRKFAKNWSLERIAKIDLSILRLAVYELNFCQTSAPIVINEALELSKIYSSDDAKRFINGILDHIAKENLQKDV